MLFSAIYKKKGLLTPFFNKKRMQRHNSAERAPRTFKKGLFCPPAPIGNIITPCGGHPYKNAFKRLLFAF
jgi:hypothetical protein